MSFFLDIPATGQMHNTAIKADGWRQFRECGLECALYRGATLLAEKYFIETDEGYILETVIESQEKEECHV